MRVGLQGRIFQGTLLALFLIVPFYSSDNIGGTGLTLTYNIPVWLIASWIMAAGLSVISIKQSFAHPKLWFFFVLFPSIVIVSSLMSDGSQSITWLFRQFYILGGLVFLFALFQFSVKQKSIDDILFVLVLATGLHALIGTLQTLGFEDLTFWIPSKDFVPRGNFQQINVQVSFLVTGLITSLYLISRPGFRKRSTLTKLVVMVSFGLATYVIIASGSRVGLLAMFLGVPLVLWSRYHQLKHHKELLTIICIIACTAIVAGQAGLHRTLDKASTLSEKSYSTARVAMYTIGLELVAKEPVYGTGIGSFRRVWNKQSSDFVVRHPETVLPQSVGHPHNEILFWMIEGGISVVLGIFAVIIGIILALKQCGFQRGGAYAAMLLPISLHTQVELPFYISAVHWFLWLFLIYLVLRHQTKIVEINISKAATRLLQIVAIVFAFSATIFMVNTTRAQTDLYHFLYDKNVQPPYLQLALNNIYFKPMAEQVAMRSMLYASIENNDRARVKIFETWAQEYVEINPELKMYEDLISASVFLRPEGKGCDVIKEGLTMYAHNKPLQQAYKDNCPMQD